MFAFFGIAVWEVLICGTIVVPVLAIAAVFFAVRGSRKDRNRD
ncbi:MAG TPA: hypothetical protein VHC22_00670 [Pirellulales bacterium]|nr:hypothetical protein [Pirellulales bacterium]